MTILELSKKAQDYYNGLRALTCASGWEKYVLTNGETCMFVDSNYEPQAGEVVFYLQTRMRNTMCELHKQNL